MSDSAARPNAGEEWENLLRQWQTQPAAQPRPYFYSRVRAKLAHQAAPERPLVRTWLRWPAYAVMLSALLLLSGDDAGLQSAGKANPASTDSPGVSLGSEYSRTPGP